MHYKEERSSAELSNDTRFNRNRLGKVEQCMALDESLSALTAKVLGDNHFETLASKARLGISKIEIGQVEEGRDLLQFVFEAEPNLTGAYKIAGLIANSFEEAGSFENALHWTRREIEGARKTLPANSLPLMEALTQSSTRLLKLTRWNEAEALLHECDAILGKNSTRAKEQYLVRSQLGRALVAQAKYQDALSHLISAYEGAQKLKSDRPKGLRGMVRADVERIITCCEALNKQDVAAAYRQELAKMQSMND